MGKYSDNHTVYLNSKNEEVPSVTTILKVINKPAIAYWANYMGFKRKDIKSELKKTADVGTDFHSMVSDYTMGRAISGEHLDRSIALFKMFKEWAVKNEYKTIMSEESMSSDRFGGTIDSVSHVNGTLCMVDYKTSKNIYASMFLQLAGYSILIKENKPYLYEAIEKYGILSISEKNGVRTKFVDRHVIEETYVPVFLAVTEFFYKWFNVNLVEWKENIAH